MQNSENESKKIDLIRQKILKAKKVKEILSEAKKHADSEQFDLSFQKINDAKEVNPDDPMIEKTEKEIITLKNSYEEKDVDLWRISPLGNLRDR